MEQYGESPRQLQKMLDLVDKENILILKDHKLWKHGSHGLKP